MVHGGAVAHHDWRGGVDRLVECGRAVFVLTDVVRVVGPPKIAPPTGTLFSWVMNNYWFTNTAASSTGEIELVTFSARSRTSIPVAATRLGRELPRRRLPARSLNGTRRPADPRLLPARAPFRAVLPENVERRLRRPLRRGCWCGCGSHRPRHRDGMASRFRPGAGRRYACTATEDRALVWKYRPTVVHGAVGAYEVVTIMLADSHD